MITTKPGTKSTNTTRTITHMNSTQTNTSVKLKTIFLITELTKETMS
jgi:hypothetical protein